MTKDAKVAIGSIVGFIAFIFVIVLLAPSSPISIFNNDGQNQEMIDALKDDYREQGVELEDSDISIETVTDENGETKTVASVSDSKRDQAKANAQSNLDKVIGDAIGVNPPKRDPETGKTIGSEDEDTVFPSVDDVIETINISNSRVREFINSTLDAKDEYGRLLLEQRWNGSPSSSTEFPYVLFTTPSTYGQLQPTMNGECFFYANYPDSIRLDNQKHFYPWLNTSSDSLYSNLITRQLYKFDLELGGGMVIESYPDKTYTLVNSTSTFQYQSLIKVKVSGCSYILGMRNNSLILLDAE